MYKIILCTHGGNIYWYFSFKVDITHDSSSASSNTTCEKREVHSIDTSQWLLKYLVPMDTFCKAGPLISLSTLEPHLSRCLSHSSGTPEHSAALCALLLCTCCTWTLSWGEHLGKVTLHWLYWEKVEHTYAFGCIGKWNCFGILSSRACCSLFVLLWYFLGFGVLMALTVCVASTSITGEGMIGWLLIRHVWTFCNTCHFSPFLPRFWFPFFWPKLWFFAKKKVYWYVFCIKKNSAN